MRAAATVAGNFAISDRAHGPCRTGADHSGLFAGPVGLCRGAHDWGDTADRNTLSGASGGLGVIAALDDRPRAGRDPVITTEAKTWWQYYAYADAWGVTSLPQVIGQPRLRRVPMRAFVRL